jgi:hypothetical protein
MNYDSILKNSARYVYETVYYSIPSSVSRIQKEVFTLHVSNMTLSLAGPAGVLRIFANGRDGGSNRCSAISGRALKLCKLFRWQFYSINVYFPTDCIAF